MLKPMGRSRPSLTRVLWINFIALLLMLLLALLAPHLAEASPSASPARYITARCTRRSSVGSVGRPTPTPVGPHQDRSCR